MSFPRARGLPDRLPQLTDHRLKFGQVPLLGPDLKIPAAVVVEAKQRPIRIRPVQQDGERQPGEGGFLRTANR